MNKFSLLAIGLLAVGSVWSKEPPQKKIKKLSKQSQNFVDNLVLFEEGTITSGRSIAGLIPTKRDTALLFTSTPKRIQHTAFAMSKYEVTNKEYREFEIYVFDSICRTELAKSNPKYLLSNSKLLNWSVEIEQEHKDSILKTTSSTRFYKGQWDQVFLRGNNTYRYSQNGQDLTVTISPDQEVWTKDFSYSFNEPMVNMYYWHPAYDNYPVVGVSAEQAEAYSHWYTQRFYKSLDADQKELFKGKSFRLPSSLEWESAAQSKGEDDVLDGVDIRNTFAWTGSASCGMQGNYGSIVDENNFNLKYFSGDGGFHTVKVDSYVAGMNGIHNMSGNVCEWTSTEARDTIFITILGNTASFLPGEDKKSIEDKIRPLIPPARGKGFTEERVQGYIQHVHHDCQVLEKYKAGVYVKGGSWADPLIYAMIDKKEVYLKDHQSSRIGFRLALDLDEDLIEFLD